MADGVESESVVDGEDGKFDEGNRISQVVLSSRYCFLEDISACKLSDDIRTVGRVKHHDISSGLLEIENHKGDRARVLHTSVEGCFSVGNVYSFEGRTIEFEGEKALQAFSATFIRDIDLGSYYDSMALCRTSAADRLKVIDDIQHDVQLILGRSLNDSDAVVTREELEKCIRFLSEQSDQEYEHFGDVTDEENEGDDSNTVGTSEDLGRTAIFARELEALLDDTLLNVKDEAPHTVVDETE